MTQPVDQPTQSRLSRLGAKLLGCWQALNVVPNCPACKGTGEPTGRYRNWADPVYWKGEVVWVCHNCKGTGKV